MTELNIEAMSFSDLMQIKSILVEKLKAKENWVNIQRGYDLEEYNRGYLIYYEDKNHEKLGRINKQIEYIINNI